VLCAAACFVVGYFFGYLTGYDVANATVRAEASVVVAAAAPIAPPFVEPSQPQPTVAAPAAKVKSKAALDKAHAIKVSKRSYDKAERAAYEKAARNAERAVCLLIYADVVGDWYVKNGTVKDGRVVADPRDDGAWPDDAICEQILEYRSSYGR
jgi:hypothetical protein